MSEKADGRGSQKIDWNGVFRRLIRALASNWKLKLTSVLVALAVWGGLISEDATLTREKLFAAVQVNVTGMETLQRNGLIVVSGLEGLQPIKVRAEVPQKAYENALPSHYSVRVDVSRITAAGPQTLPIQTSASTAYGTVTWMSQTEVTLVAEEYITRRRIPIRLEQTGSLPEEFWGSNATVDPVSVVVSGPRSQVERIAYVRVNYRLDLLRGESGAQYVAAPFQLVANDGALIDRKLINVTSENILLDTLLVEQTLYPLKRVAVNLSGVVIGETADGYEIAGVTADPDFLLIAGKPEDIDEIRMLGLSTEIDISEHRETLIRALKVEKPAGVVYLSENAVYVTIEIRPVPPASGRLQ